MLRNFYLLLFSLQTLAEVRPRSWNKASKYVLLEEFRLNNNMMAWSDPGETR